MSDSHYHIRFFPSGKLHWQRFDNARDAERRAKELALRDERYVIEPIVGECDTCGSVTPRSAKPENPKKNAANG